MKKQFRSTASSGRAASGAATAFGGFGGSAADAQSSSSLSHVSEPPDLSSISDSNVVVAFKNLMKKDPTTKFKALEDIQAHVAPPEYDIEEGLLAAWIKLYPRLSIDTSRRVRQSSHSLVGLVASKAGKRIGPHLPHIIGAWLCGTFDSDRAASKAAHDALQQTFPTQEKLQNIWKVLQRSIAEYCRDAILYETPQTLSDERSVSKDDSEATYYRVVSTSLAVINKLVTDLSIEQLGKHSDVYDALLGDKQPWELACASDPATRKATLRLLHSCIARSKYSSSLDISLIGTILINKALPADQASSAADLVSTLLELTKHRPSVWTNDYAAKKSPESRLRHFVKRGSQSSGSQYWAHLEQLVSQIPREALPSTTAGAQDFVAAVFDGVTSRDERLNTSQAWSSYFVITDLLLKQIPETDRDTILEQQILPAIDNYLDPQESRTKWNVVGTSNEKLFSKAVSATGMPSLLARRWPDFASRLIDLMKMSQPEQAKDFQQSQQVVVDAGQRYVKLTVEITSREAAADSALKRVLEVETLRAIKDAIQLLIARQGKPFGAAAFLVGILECRRKVPFSPDIYKPIFAFLQGEALDLLESPSQLQLMRLLRAAADAPDFQPTWKQWAGRASEDASSRGSLSVLSSFLTVATPDEALDLPKQHEALQTALRRVLSAHDTDVQDPTTRTKLLIYLNKETEIDILTEAMGQLSTTDSAGAGLDQLTAIAQAQPRILQDFIAREEGHELLAKVVLLEESSFVDLAEQAKTLHQYVGGPRDSSQRATVSLDLVSKELQTTRQESIPIQTLLDMARPAVSTSLGDLWQLLNRLLPEWQEAIQHSAAASPHPAVSIMNPLAGAAYLVKSDTSTRPAPKALDRQGLSKEVRIALFALEILSALTDDQRKDSDALIRILSSLIWTSLLVGDELDVRGSNGSFVAQRFEKTSDLMADFVAQSTKMVFGYLTSGPSSSSLADLYLTANRNNVSADSYLDFCKARAFLQGFTEINENKGVDKTLVGTLDSNELKILRKERKPLALSTIIAALAPQITSAPGLQRLSNELVANLTGADAEGDEEGTLKDLVYLNLVFRHSDGIDGIVAKQRLVFYLKRSMDWLQNAGVAAPIKSEVLTSLQTVLPQLSDIYGEHWEQLLDLITATLKGDPSVAPSEYDVYRLPLQHAALRLLGVMQAMRQEEEPNEDLLDAFKEHQDRLSAGVLAALIAADDDEKSIVPLRIVNEVLARQAVKLPAVDASSAEQLYQKLYAQSTAIEGAAFTLLQRHIEVSQEQISLDSVLEKKTAHLPEEILSLILTPPSMEKVLAADFEAGVPLDLQTYLHAWLLIFAHFPKASSKVREDYVEDIRSNENLPALLDLVFDFLGHTISNPVDASKFDVTSYARDQEESAERDTQWLLAHLYYLSLLYIPSLTKSHILNITNRQTSTSINSWTAKYISPLIISASLQSVTDWSASVSSDPDYENFTVKVSPRSKEITATFLIDEQTMGIVIRLPDEYPLAGVKVEGLSRVAVDSKKWNSWLRNCQGVIQFSNGNLVDGVTTWRRNVMGALRGQTECAICYSIISADKQLPSKRCGTCKNLFHSGCLFKWFRSSNASTCPLCRNPFNYG